MVWGCTSPLIRASGLNPPFSAGVPSLQFLQAAHVGSGRCPRSNSSRFASRMSIGFGLGDADPGVITKGLADSSGVNGTVEATTTVEYANLGVCFRCSLARSGG